MTITTSAQDVTTALKRRVIAATFTQNPPPAFRRYNATYLSVLANKVGLTMNNTQGGGHTYTNNCCVVAGASLAGSLI